MLGNCTFNGAPVSNCQTYRDPSGNRTALSTVPFIQEQLKRMPSPNEFTGGDGLNTANIRFVRRQEGLDLTNGNGDEVNREIIQRAHRPQLQFQQPDQSHCDEGKDLGHRDSGRV